MRYVPLAGRLFSVGATRKAGESCLRSGKPEDLRIARTARYEILLLSLAAHRYIVAPKTQVRWRPSIQDPP